MPHQAINTRWFNAVLHDRGMSQRELCRRLGLDSSAMSLTFRGKRQMKMTEAVDIARLLGVPLPDVLENAGIRLDGSGMRHANVVGYVDSVGEAHLDWHAHHEHVSAPSDLPEEVVAIVAKCQHPGELSLLDGWTYFVSPPMEPSADIVGRYCFAGVRGGVTLLRFVRRGYKPGTFNLVGLVSAGVESAELDWVAPVLMIRPV